MPLTFAQLVADLVAGKKRARRALMEYLLTAPLSEWLGAAAHASERVRRAAVGALRTAPRLEPEVVALVSELSRDSDASVRAELARALGEGPIGAPCASAVAPLLRDGDAAVRRAAARAARGRRDLAPLLLELLAGDPDWEVRRQAATALAGAEAGGPAGAATIAALVRVVGTDRAPAVAGTAARTAEALLERRLEGGEGADPDELPLPDDADLARGLKRVTGFGREQLTHLAELLEARVAHHADPSELVRYGTDLTAAAEAGELPRAFGVEPVIAAVQRALASEGGSRSAVLVGPVGAGKTACVHELVHRLRDAPGGGWRVLRVSPSDVLAGTVYLGEWQTKVRDLIATVRAPRRVLLYVPNIEELSAAGRTSNNDTNLATMLAPSIECGDVAILGETSPEAWRGGLGASSLQRLFARIEVAPRSGPGTAELLDLVAAERGVELAPAFRERLLELSDAYVPGVERPGRAVALLRRLLARGRPLAPRDVLLLLHESTGIPVDFLDDDRPLDLAAVRAFFEARVMGQPAAIDAVLDLVTLVKAGLCDPGKPPGVLLFVGPTGVGKTELARALAEQLFGDPARLVRFDMSEFATYAAYERLLGSAGQPGLLTGAVQANPFAVILLDEVEKAHVNVFDVCLQIFDAGRLTDCAGRTADFTSAILILTSNVGSTVRTQRDVGFSGAAPGAPDRDSIERELGLIFRPEFLNRIDRVVHFRPLELETAERIARREVARVIERSGIVRRHLAVEVDPAVVALLLRQGYSPAFGARPLKRTVEQLVLLPVARAIATGEAPAGTIVRLVERGGAVAAVALAGDAADEPVGPPEVPELPVVRARIEELRDSAAPLEERRAELLTQVSAAGFWDERERALRTLDAVHRVDKLLQDLAALEHELERTASNPDRERAAEFLSQHAREAERLGFLLTARDLSDALVVVTRVKATRAGLDGVLKLARMYRGFAERRGFECLVLDDCAGGDPPEDRVALLIGGAGAHALLRGEAGLHQLLRPGAGAGRPVMRDLVRVEVLRAPTEAPTFAEGELRVETRPLGEVCGRLLNKPTLEVRILHVPSLASVVLWSAAGRDEAVRQGSLLLGARLADEPGASAATAIVRRYRLGAAPLVRDRRTGRSSGRLERVLRGELELFLVPPDQPST